MLKLTPQEEVLIQEYRLNSRMDHAFNVGLEFAAKKAEEWSREGGGVTLLDNFARSLRTHFKPERDSL